MELLGRHHINKTLKISNLYKTSTGITLKLRQKMVSAHPSVDRCFSTINDLFLNYLQELLNMNFKYIFIVHIVCLCRSAAFRKYS